MNNVERIKETLKEIQAQHRAAEGAFAYAQSKIERINNTPINIYYDDVVGRIREAIETAMDACEALYETCQKLVLALDHICRPLLDKDTPASVVADVAHEIRQLNEDSRINNDYTGNFEGISFGDIAKITYSPTYEAEEIERFWDQLARKQAKMQEDNAYVQKHGITPEEIPQHKKYMELIAKMDRATSSKAMIEIRDAFVAMGNCWDTAGYIAQCDKRIAALQAEEAEAQRQAELERIEAEKRKKKQDDVAAECDAKVAAFGAALQQQVERLMERFQTGLQQQIAAVKQEKERQEYDLSQLGFFAFGKKKAKKEEILRLEQQLLALQNPENVTGEKRRLSSLAGKAKKKYGQQVKEYLYKRFPSLEPKEPTYVFPGTNEGISLQILYLMKSDVPYLVTDVIEMLEQKGRSVSASYVTMLLRKLKDSGKVLRMEMKGRAYFKRSCDLEYVLSKVQKDPETPDYMEVAAYANVPCPEPPSMEKVFGTA